MYSRLLSLVALLFTCSAIVFVESACPSDKLQTCLNMAYEFLENDRFIFPTTKEDVEDVCNTWSKFLECIESYVSDCLDARQKTEFKDAVGSILDSVRSLCTDPTYQQQYFKHADCIKKTCTDDQYCGSYYKQLIRQVAQEFDTNQLCCNYRQFDNCVLVNTNAVCGSTARDFASAMLNKAMSFLTTRCQGSSQSLESCSENSVMGSGGANSLPSATNAPSPLAAGSRALPMGPLGSTTTTSRWTPTKEPQSMAYENGHANIAKASATTIAIALSLVSYLCKYF